MGLPSETEMDSAASLRGETERVTVLCLIRGWRWRWALWGVPGRDAALDGLAVASELRSLCLNTSLGLKDRWEMSDLASCRIQTAAESVGFPHPRQRLTW